MIALILGTRPEIVKMSPIVRELERRGEPFKIVHTGQHFSYSMDRSFFEQLKLPDPDVNLEVGPGTHAVMTGRIMEGLEKVLSGMRPHETLVQGDTNTVLGGALVCAKLHLRTGHVEAGLRSYDRRMPEEINRIVADHICDHLYAPTKLSRELLSKEGVDPKRVFLTGNTVVDAVEQNLEIAKRSSQILKELELTNAGYILATSHREENVDDPVRFKGIIEGLKKVSSRTGAEVIYPVHPRAKKRMEEHHIDAKGIRLMEPVGYLEFLQLESRALLVITDSGGVQEEACILGVPCVTMRDSTERPETISVGANLLGGTDPESILKASLKMLDRSGKWSNPFGDGKAAGKILDIALS